MHVYWEISNFIAVNDVLVVGIQRTFIRTYIFDRSSRGSKSFGERLRLDSSSERGSKFVFCKEKLISGRPQSRTYYPAAFVF